MIRGRVNEVDGVIWIVDVDVRLGGGGIQRNTKEDKQQQTLRSLLGCLRLLRDRTGKQKEQEEEEEE